jgi:hypothetical protein
MKRTFAAFSLLSLFTLLLSFPDAAHGRDMVVVSSVAYDSGADDTADCVTADSDGNVIVAGNSFNGTNFDYRIIKYNRYLVPGTALTVLYDGGGMDEVHGITPDSSDNIIVTGESEDANNISNYFTIKYDPTLQTVLSSAVYDGGGGDWAMAAARDSQDNCIVTGHSDDGSTFNIYTIKYDHNLHEVAHKKYDSGKVDKAYGVAVDGNDNIVIAGCSDNKAFVIKYDGDFNFVASAVQDTLNSSEARAVAVDSGDNVIIAGRQYVGSTWDYYIVKYNSDLGVTATVTFDSGQADEAKGVTVDSQDNIIVTGKSGSQYLTLKYDQYLRLVSSGVYDGGPGSYAAAVAVDESDNVIVAGTGYDSVNLTNNYFTIKYSASPSLTSIGKAFQGETGELRIVGRGFLAGARVSFADPRITAPSAAVTPPNQIVAAVTVSTAVPLGVSTITVTNANDEYVTCPDLFEVQYRKFVDNAQDTTITSFSDRFAISVTVPAGAFQQSSTLTIAAMLSTAPAAGTARPTLVGARISLVPALTVLKDITVRFTYRDEDAAGFDERRFSVGYYDDATLSWVDTESAAAPAENRATCWTRLLNHTFAVIELGSGATGPGTGTVSGNASVYPNPYKPGSGTAYDNTIYGEGIVFGNLTKEFKITILTVSGDLVLQKVVEPDAHYRYLWDTKNESGAKVASGVYVYVITDAGGALISKGKFSIIR